MEAGNDLLLSAIAEAVTRLETSDIDVALIEVMFDLDEDFDELDLMAPLWVANFLHAVLDPEWGSRRHVGVREGSRVGWALRRRNVRV